MRITRTRRRLLGALGALILVAGGLAVSGTHPVEARNCLIHRCDRWQCQHTFHQPANQRGQPRRYCTPACRVAEHRRLNM